MWQKHPFKLLLYVEWVLLGIALLTTITFVIPYPRHHLMHHSPLFNFGAIFCLIILGLMGLKLPFDSKLGQVGYLTAGFILSWLTVLLGGKGERIFPALLLIVVIRACLFFSWRGRIFTAIVAYFSFLSLQIMVLMRVEFLGITLGRPLPRLLRRLPTEDLHRVLFGLAFNSALLFGFVLAFVLLLVGAVLAEHEGREKLMAAHRRLRDYALQIENQTILKERNRIAREIHDSVGHHLTAQSIQLENTALFLTGEPEKAAKYLSQARKLGKEALTNIRASVATLRENLLPENSTQAITAKDFLALVQQLIAEFQLNTNIAVILDIAPISSLSPETATAIYRIIQEAFTNITKHSQATSVAIQLQEKQSQVSLIIQDNGCGFDPQDNTTGFGLQGMQERTAALQGKFKIESTLGKGCHISVRIPANEVKSARNGESKKDSDFIS